MNFLKSEEINIKFTYNSQTDNELKFNLNEKMENIFKKYADHIGVNLESLFFLYNGIKIEEFDKNLNDVINNEDKNRKEMNIVAYNMGIYESVRVDTNYITIIFSVLSKSIIKMQFKKEEKMKNICFQFASQNGYEFEGTIFKYSGQEIDINKTFDEIANSYDRQCNGMTILVYKKHPLKVNFKHGEEPYEIQSYKEDKVKDVFLKYTSEKNLILNELSFSYFYNNTINNYDQTFNELINKYPDSSDLNLNYNITNQTNESFDNSIDKIDIYVNDIIPTSCFKKHKKLIIILSIVGILIIIGLIIIIIIVMKKKHKDPDPNPSDTIEFTDYPSETIKPTDYPIPNTTIEPTDFPSDTIRPSDTIIETSHITVKPKTDCETGYFIPDDDETLQDCQKCSLEGCIKCKGTYTSNECITCGYKLIPVTKNNKIIKCNYTCEIGEEEKCLICSNKTNECEKCNLGYKLKDGKCEINYLIKATYTSYSEDEPITLIANQNTKITQMIVDGKNITPIKTYDFPERGDHTVYFLFGKVTSSSSTGIFRNLDRLKSIHFSDFNEYFPDINFKWMFTDCINLISVDLSKLKFRIITPLESMFENCINLKYVIFKKKTIDAMYGAPRMFKNCTSLTSVDISTFNMTKMASTSTSLDYMFADCISLQSINLSGVNPETATSLKYMFHNCSSLKKIDFPSFNLSKAENISYMFANCISLRSLDLSNFRPRKLKSTIKVFMNCSNLTSINLNNFATHSVVYMDGLFYGCKSLTFINISTFNFQNTESLVEMFAFCTSLKSFDITKTIFNTTKVTQMQRMFYECNSLTSLNFPKAFETNKVKYFNAMFYNCTSLKSINVSFFNVESLTSMYCMFYGCTSLTSIDLSNFKSSNIGDLQGLFFNCINLKYIDISSIGYKSYNHDYYYKIVNANISSNGTILLKNNTYQIIQKLKIIPKNWTIIVK